MSDTNHSRRHFLQSSTTVAAMAPAAAAFGLQMAAVSAASSQSATDGYKALICIFLVGGNDSNNTVLATDEDSWSRYWRARNTGFEPIALMPPGTPKIKPGKQSPITKRTARPNTPEAWGGVLPIVPNTAQKIPAGTNASQRTFGLHPMLAPLLPIYDAGRLAVLANVGTLIEPVTKSQFLTRKKRLPANLMGHDGQRFLWQGNFDGVVPLGWGGRFADLMASANGDNAIFTSMSTSGYDHFLRGRKINQYQMSFGPKPAIPMSAAYSKPLFGSTEAARIVRKVITDTSSGSDMAADYAAIVSKSLGANWRLNNAAASTIVDAIPEPPIYKNPITGDPDTNVLSEQLQAVARMIAAAQELGLKRQVFMVTMSGHDSHNNQNDEQPDNLSKLAHAMATFDATLANIGGADMRSRVTAFTASDFSRTFSTNGDGTDHAWGGHHFIMGGAVKGRDIYGQYPTLGTDGGNFRNPDMARSYLVPTTSVDQFAATMGSWFGVSSADLNLIFPNLNNFSTPNLGFML